MVYVYLAEGFEQIEAVTPIDVLKRAGVEVKTVGVTGTVMRSVHGMTITPDIKPEDVSFEDMEMIVLPGGMPGAAYLAQSPAVKAAIEHCMDKDKYIAAICAAPMVLAQYGILKGKKATCFPGVCPKLEDGGATVMLDESVVIDGKIITGRAAGASFPFAFALATALKGQEIVAEVIQDLYYVS